MQKSVRLMVCRFIFVTVVVALFALSSFAQDYPGGDQGDQPSYPGIPPSQGKLEGTLGSYNLRVYGAVLLNISGSDTPPVGGDVPLWAPLSSGRTTFLDGTSKRVDDVHDLIFTARQSIVGFIVKPATASGDAWQPSGKVEIDFFGTRPVDIFLQQGRVLNQPRLRFAYFQLAKKGLKITAGQDKAILAPLDPVSLSHVAIPLGATAGNLWAWLPQVRLDVSHDIGNTTLLFQGGGLRPQFGDPRLGDLPAVGTSVEGAPGLGERSTQPFYQGRIAVSHPLNGSKVTVGASGHYGRERVGAERTLNSAAFAVDYAVPLHSRVTWRGEGFIGTNLAPFQGGILQGVSFIPAAGATPALFKTIDAAGGWTELIIRATADSKNVVYLGVGEDDPRDRDLLTGTTRSRNELAWASFFHKLNDNVTIALEWSNWQFKTRTIGPAGVPTGQGPSGTANVFNVGLAYQF